MKLHELVKRAAKRGDARLHLWRPSWPSTSFLRVNFNSAGVVEPMGEAFFLDDNGHVLDRQPVVMLFAPVADDYEESSLSAGD